MIISGIITNGLGVAVQTIDQQRPFFKERGLKNLDQLQNGTINIDISPKKFSILSFDYFYKNINWESKGTEDFGFIEIKEIKYNGKIYSPGYIYIPHNSPHFSNTSHLEVVAVTIPDIDSGHPIELLVNDGKIQLLD